MQTFIDTVTNKVYQFEPDVVATDISGVYSFTTASGIPLTSLPTTLQPYTIPAPTTAQLASQAQTAQLTALSLSYAAAIQTPVSYTSKGGVTKTFQAGSGSISNLQNTILGYQAAGTTPSGFYWVSADNTQVPFTYADLQGLAAVMVAQGWTAFQHLQTQKAAINTIVNLPARAAGASYTTGVQIVDGNGNVWSCTTQGTAGTTCTFPASPTTGTTKTDGGVTWTYINSQVSLIQSIVW